VFDNLIGQDEVRSLLEGDLRGGSLPPSLLFSGPPASGKLTTALELARILSCEGADRGAWSCPCSSCARHRSLAHPDLLLFGRRSFPEEIPVALETLLKTPGKAGAYLFLRALRKLEKRFDPTLYEGEETKLAKAAPLVADIEERLALVDPGAELWREDAEGRARLEKAAADLLPVARKLEALVTDMPPVSQVRSAELWCRLAPWGRRKTVIIENAEAMNDSARNALLKILEEPPRSLTFVLVSSRRPAMMRTILSRVRTYAFSARDASASALVLEKVFRAGGAASLEGSGPALLSIDGWLASKRPFPPARARDLAGYLLAATFAEAEARGASLGPGLADRAASARGEGPDIPGALALILSETKELGQRDETYDQSFAALLEALEDLLGELLREPALAARDLDRASRAAGILRETRARRETYNLSASLLLESLAWKLAEVQ